MNKSIELRNFINHDTELNVENLKLENKNIDKSEQLDTNAMNKCIITGIILLIIVIIFSILAVKYVLNPNTRISNNNIKKDDSNNQSDNNNNNPIPEKQNDKENEENDKPIDKDKEESTEEITKEEENPKEAEKSDEEQKPKEKEKPNIEKPKENSDSRCTQYDPINLFSKRLQTKPITVGQNGNSKHICYQEESHLFVLKRGVVCKMENIVLDPSKWRDNGLIYKGPVDPSDRGCPLLSKGFFNMKSEIKNDYGKNFHEYHYYFDGWNYDYEEDDEDLEELAPGKTIFFLSRNQDSPNLFHGGSEYMNALSIMYLLNLDPKDIQVIFLESINIQNDPFYDLYKYLISRGGDPFHVRTLKKKYHITSAIHIPINWDSPCFITSGIPSCQYPSLAYKYFNDLVDYYMDIKPYKDSFISDNDVYYYPKSVIEHHKANKNFKKIITFQWRRVWPRGRSSQGRILGNGPELVEKLSKSLPENYLIRLIDTAGLSISEQISIMRTTDYFIGAHGAGLFLGIFTPNHCPFHEVLSAPNMNGLLLMGALSGHRTFSDVIQANNKRIDGSDYIFFNENAFVNKIIQRMKSTDFI